MGLVNVIDVPTLSGIKTVEVHHGDITSSTLHIDLLLVSAFQRSYHPTPGTVIHALEENMGISTNDLSINPLVDLRGTMDSWISRKITDKPIKYLGCVENVGSNWFDNGTPEDGVGNVFALLSLLFFKDPEISTVAMPILGTGKQNARLGLILPILIEKAIQSLSFNHHLKTVYFIEKTVEKANSIDVEINHHLKRSENNLEFVADSNVENEILGEVLKKLVILKSHNEHVTTSDTIETLISRIQDKDMRFFELGILSRKLIELLLSDLLDSEKKGHTLFESIKELKGKNVTDWMLAYLHTIRIFGNSVAHETVGGIPVKMNQTDVIVLLHALSRALDFAINHGKEIKTL